MKYTIGEIARAVSGTVHGDAQTTVCGVCIDTRKLVPGHLFVALKGEGDGHAYLDEAIGKQAAALLVEKNHARQDFPCVAVDDTLAALQAWGKYHRDQFAVPVVAVTGSNGKTTTKDMLAEILAQVGPVASTQGNFNNEIGLPLTLLSMEPEHWAAVTEMGMRGLGQITQLAELARPQVGIVVNVYPVHLELLGTIERIAQAKGELVRALPPEGTAVLNADDPLVSAMAQWHAGPVLTFGMEQRATVWADGYRDCAGRAAFTLHLPEHCLDILLPVPGLHNVYNALAAAAGALALGVGPEAIKAGLTNFVPSDMRSHRQRIGPITVLNDAYNASPASMRFALGMLAEQRAEGRRIAVLGDMLELGPIAEQAHRTVGQQAAAIPVDLLITVGKLGQLIAQGAQEAGLGVQQIKHFEDSKEAAAAVPSLLAPEDLVLVKASRGMKLELVVEGIVAAWEGVQC